jgi:hypothetical protein
MRCSDVRDHLAVMIDSGAKSHRPMNASVVLISVVAWFVA